MRQVHGDGALADPGRTGDHHDRYPGRRAVRTQQPGQPVHRLGPTDQPVHLGRQLALRGPVRLHWSRPGRGEVRFRRAGEHDPLPGLQLRTGFDPQLAPQAVADPAERLQRLGAAAGQGQGGHEMAPEPLPQGIPGDQLL